MAFTIAVAGKGGTGKTTLCALIIRYLLEHGIKPILAVDADANANLNEALGLEVNTNISNLIAECSDQIRSLPPGMSKEDFVEVTLESALIEGSDVDLLIMGGPEGPGCYCYPNSVLRKLIDRMSQSYKCVVMDNEAGLEHLSRRTTDKVDLMFITTDASARGVRSAARIHDLVNGLKLEVKSKYLIMSRTTGESEVELLSGELAKTGLQLLGTIPLDSGVVEYDLLGKPLLSLPADNPAVKASREIFEKVPELSFCYK